MEPLHVRSLATSILILSISFAFPAITGAQDRATTVANEEAAPAFAPGFFSIGVSGLVGLRDDPRHDIAPTWTYGLDVGFRLLPFLSIHARRITLATALPGGERHGLGASPAIELALPFWPRVQPFVQIGAAIQARFGGAQGRETGVAPFLGTGVRLFVTEWLSLAPEGAVHVPVTDGGFLLGGDVMPQGSIVLQAGLAIAFHNQ